MDAELETQKKEEEDEEDDNNNEPKGLLYKVDDIPPWYLCLLLGFQQFLTAFGATFGYPMLIKDSLCIAGDQVGLSELIGTVIFVSGMSTCLQSILGVRLPIIQSASYAFITPIFVILSLNADKCPFNNPNANATLPELGSDEHREIWKNNLRELQGCLMVGSCVSIFIGFSGIVGLLMKFIGPLTVAPTICLITLSLFEAAYQRGEAQWYICIMTIALIAIFSQYLRNVSIPCGKVKVKFFALFPVLLAVAVSWILCVIFTETDVFPSTPGKWGYRARTDLQSDVLKESKWFRFPYPGQWGVPKVTIAGCLGMSAAVLSSTIESVGDYYACARLSGAPPPPSSAVSRGIGVEGITCLLAGAWGTGAGTTSYSENIGAIGITKVGSRVVVLAAGVIMMLLGCLGKFGALFVTIPDPVVGGLFFVMFGIVVAVGVSNLQFVDLNSPRNMFVFGVPLFFGFSLSRWVSLNSASINTGDSNVDQVIQVLLGTSMFVGGALAFILDNTIPGTAKERGLIAWIQQGKGQNQNLAVYDLPYIQPYLNKLPFMKYIPVCPNFVLDNKQRSRDTELAEGGREERNTGESNGHGATNEAFVDDRGITNTSF